MDFAACIRERNAILMEGALGERLKRDFGLAFDSHVAMARLLYAPQGAAALRALWTEYQAIAQAHGLPFLATTPTRRANRERCRRAGCDGRVILDNVRFLRELWPEPHGEIYVGGLMGCRGDAYTGADAIPTAGDARDFHRWQADLFREAGVDFLYAGIMPTLPEATGMAQAMADTGLPYLISFTIRANGRLIDGTPISAAITHIDRAAERPPLCYMTNCVHPRITCTALRQACNRDEIIQRRFWGTQANTSLLPYDALDGASALQEAEPGEFAEDMLRLRQVVPIRIFGGCCGTDGRHMKELARRLASQPPSPSLS